MTRCMQDVTLPISMSKTLEGTGGTLLALVPKKISLQLLTVKRIITFSDVMNATLVNASNDTVLNISKLKN